MNDEQKYVYKKNENYEKKAMRTYASLSFNEKCAIKNANNNRWKWWRNILRENCDKKTQRSKNTSQIFTT